MIGHLNIVARRALSLMMLLGSSASVASAATLVFTGAGAVGTAAAITAFKAAVGGIDNGTAPPASSGFRSINWDAVKLDGTDFAGNTRVISPNKTVGIPVNRFATRGVTFAEVYAVSGDGFTSVNPSVAGQFPAFTTANTFAMFNETSIEMAFNKPGDPLTPAAVRALGIVFVDVEIANTSSIELLRGTASLGKWFAPVGGNGQPSFLGVVLDAATATHAEVVPGTAQVFDFNGGAVTPGAAENLIGGRDLAVTDDFFYSEPVVDLTAPCLPSDSILCLDDQSGDRRFRAAVTFATVQGNAPSGVGQAVGLGSLGVNRGGLFWFFGADNPELLVKVLNACGINDRFWVFFSAGTNVGFKLSVLDTQTGTPWSFTNPDLTPAPPVQDTGGPLLCH